MLPTFQLTILIVLSLFFMEKFAEKCQAKITVICLKPTSSVRNGIKNNLGFTISQNNIKNISSIIRYGIHKPKKPINHQLAGLRNGARAESKKQ